MHDLYLTRPPRCRRLSGLVDSFEFVRSPPAHGWERMIPGGAASLVITLVEDGFDYLDNGVYRAPATCLVGPRSRPEVVSTTPQAEMVAVTFRPGGLDPFLTAPVAAVRNTYLDLGEVWRGPVLSLRERVLQAGTPGRMLDVLELALLNALDPSAPSDPAVERAVLALEAGHRVSEVVEHFGTTAKPFIRRFTDRIGMPPKRYARVRRLQRLLRARADRPGVTWAELAPVAGFCDQSHLIRDFIELTGVRPSDYAPRTANEVNHLAA